MKLKTRLVNFRVTEEEYEHLKKASLAQGARGLSEFARAATLHPPTWLAAPAGVAQISIQTHFLLVDQRLLALEATLSRMVETIESLQRERIAGQAAAAAGV
jgi:hypothetical protein